MEDFFSLTPNCYCDFFVIYSSLEDSAARGVYQPKLGLLTIFQLLTLVYLTT